VAALVRIVCSTVTTADIGLGPRFVNGSGLAI
jgi:hypothetical protein